MRHSSKEKIYAALFKGKTNLDPTSSHIKDRYERVFTKWLDDPSATETEMRKFVVNEFKVSYRQACRDLEMVKFMLGNVSIATKEWHRYTAIDMIKKGYNLVAKESSTPTDVKRGLAMIKAGEAYGKVTRLDKEDPEPLPYDDIVPQSFEPTGDVSVLGIKKVENLKELQERIRRKFGFNVEDVDVIALNENQESILQ